MAKAPAKIRPEQLVSCPLAVDRWTVVIRTNLVNSKATALVCRPGEPGSTVLRPTGRPMPDRWEAFTGRAEALEAARALVPAGERYEVLQSLVTTRPNAPNDLRPWAHYLPATFVRGEEQNGPVELRAWSELENVVRARARQKAIPPDRQSCSQRLLGHVSNECSLEAREGLGRQHGESRNECVGRKFHELFREWCGAAGDGT